jgi:hypothetical protein
MLRRFQSALKLRVVLVALVLHAGLLCAIAGLTSLPEPLDGHSSRLLVAGVAALYGAFVLAVAFIVIPAWPWVRRAQRLTHWREWIVEELPKIMAAIPVIIQFIRALRSALDEILTEAAPPTRRAQPVNMQPRQPPREARQAPRPRPRTRRSKTA